MKNIYSERKAVIIGVFITIIFIYVLRIFYLQVIDDSSKLSAKNNAFRNMIDFPPRGYIFDRKGKLLVENSLAFDLMVIPKQTKGIDTLALCKLLNIDLEEYAKRIKKACQFPNNPRKPSAFEKQINAITYAGLQEKMFRFAGFFIQKRTVRKYAYNAGAHLLGYVGEVSKIKAEKDPYYNEGDYIGISGIEKAYENILRGKKGTRIVMVDVHNQEKGKYANGAFDTAAVLGEGLYSSIDGELQKLGEDLMQNKKGSIVAIEPSTGEILAFISSPAYDPNLLAGAGKERSKNFTALFRDTVSMPLFNRALMAQYPPGSIFKLIDALVGQQEGVLTPDKVYPCAHGYPPMGGKPKCHGHPAVNLIGSIATSCNSYFSYVFRSIVDAKKYPKFTDGYDNWRKHMLTFGVGRRLDSDLPFEYPGNVPTINYYNKKFGDGGWRSNTVVSLGIGQGELGILPVQMANVVSIIANRGFYYIPHVVRGIGKDGNIDKRFKEKHYCSVEAKYFEPVIEGMARAVTGGTATKARLSDIVICGKTGTAQNPHGKDHAVFVAFAPRDNPKIAIACLVENAGFGGDWSAPISSLMIEQFINGKRTRKDLEDRLKNADLINNKNTKGFASKH
jgi:penicillin-binding protein 2